MAETTEGKDEFDEFGSVALMDYELSQAPNTISDTNSNDCNAIMKLQEQLCTMDGENKYLRSKNEKLDYHIRKVEEEKKKCLTAYEQQCTKQQEALKVDLAFKEKEILDLTQRCKILEERVTQQISSNTENGNVGGNPRPLASSNRINIDVLRPPKKRPRPISMDANELIDQDMKIPVVQPSNTTSYQSTCTQPVLNVTVALHSNAVLASEGGIKLAKLLIKGHVVDQLVCDSGCLDIPAANGSTTSIVSGARYDGYRSTAIGTLANDRFLNDSTSLESVLAQGRCVGGSASFDVGIGGNWSSGKPEDCIFNEFDKDCHGYTDMCSDSSVRILRSALSMHDSILHPHSSTSPCILHSLIKSFDSDISFLNFIENCMQRYHSFMESLSLSSVNNKTSEEESSSSGNNQPTWRFDSELSSTSLPSIGTITQWSSPSSCCSSSLSSSCSECTTTSTCSHTAELKASLPNINIVLVFTILSTLAKHNSKV